MLAAAASSPPAARWCVTQYVSCTHVFNWTKFCASLRVKVSQLSHWARSTHQSIGSLSIFTSIIVELRVGVATGHGARHGLGGKFSATNKLATDLISLKLGGQIKSWYRFSFCRCLRNYFWPHRCGNVIRGDW